MACVAAPTAFTLAQVNISVRPAKLYSDFQRPYCSDIECEI